MKGSILHFWHFLYIFFLTRGFLSQNCLISSAPVLSWLKNVSKKNPFHCICRENLFLYSWIPISLLSRHGNVCPNFGCYTCPLNTLTMHTLLLTERSIVFAVRLFLRVQIWVNAKSCWVKNHAVIVVKFMQFMSYSLCKRDIHRLMRTHLDYLFSNILIV